MADAGLQDVLRRAAPFALRALDRELLVLQRRAEQARDARQKLPPGSSRTKVTTANAKWMRLCESRDQLLKLRHELLEARRGS
jgi:hypothetical protein